MTFTRQEFIDCFKMDVPELAKTLSESDSPWVIIRFMVDDPMPFVISDYTFDTVTLRPVLNVNQIKEHLGQLASRQP